MCRSHPSFVRTGHGVLGLFLGNKYLHGLGVVEDSSCIMRPGVRGGGDRGMVEEKGTVRPVLAVWGILG